MPGNKDMPPKSNSNHYNDLGVKPVAKSVKGNKWTLLAVASAVLLLSYLLLF